MPPLTAPRAASAAEIDARNERVLENMGLVYAIAHALENRCGIPRDDLVQDGAAGLIRAAEMFDPGRGYQFSTYASYWIKQSIYRAIQETRDPIRLPAWCHTAVNRYRRIRRDRPGLDDGGSLEAMGIGRGTARARHALAAVAVAGATFGTDRDLLAELPDPATVPDRDAIDAEDWREELAAAMGRLTEQQRHVLTHRHGLDGGPVRTLAELGAELGISKEWVRRIQRSAEGRLRTILEESRP